MTRTALAPLHALLALAVVFVWGTNFVVIKLALAHLPPLTFAALRFTFAVLPWIFFFPRPKVPWWNLAAYGLLIGVGQFAILFMAMRSQISPGLASLVVQMQVFFTIGFAVLIAKEKIKGYQWTALGLAGLGLVWLMLYAGGDVTPLGMAMVLFAALSWGAGNTVARAAGPMNMLAYVVWASLFSFPPLFALALAFEGWPAIRQGLQDATLGTWVAVLWQSLGNTLFGYVAWAWLLHRYPAAVISPLSLLVPVFGMSASALLMGEALSTVKLAATGLVMAGLVINTLWPMIRRRLVRVEPL